MAEEKRETGEVKTERYRMSLSGIDFIWESRADVESLLTNLFSHCTSRRDLYLELVSSISESFVLGDGSTECEVSEVVERLRFLKVMKEIYGPTYDPGGKLFCVEEDAGGLLT